MAQMKFTLSSPELEGGERIAPAIAKEGQNRPPVLDWSHGPDARSYAIIMEDPDAPDGTFTHWLQFDIPGSESHVDGSHLPGKSGQNDFQATRYDGPHPPARAGDHRYFFRLYALDVDSLGLPEGASRDAVEEGMRGHVLAQTQLMGLYAR